jgi:hypothetical protein
MQKLVSKRPGPAAGAFGFWLGFYRRIVSVTQPSTGRRVCSTSP